VFEALHRSDADSAPAFTVEAIVDYLEAHPEVRAINAMHVGKSWTQAHKGELRTLATGAETINSGTLGGSHTPRDGLARGNPALPHAERS